MTPQGKFQGIIFDFNGVLLWDDAIQRESWKLFSTKLRNKPLTDEEIDLHVHGRNNMHTIEFLLGKPISQDKADELGEIKESIYRRMCQQLGDGFTLSPGAVCLLEILTIHQIPFTIATASQEKNVDFFFKQLSLANWFQREKIVFNNGKTPGKPAPDLFLRAAKNLGLSPKSCIVVEDSQSGIKAACNAGMGYVIALGPSTEHKRLLRLNGVNHVIETLNEINVDELLI